MNNPLVSFVSRVLVDDTINSIKYDETNTILRALVEKLPNCDKAKWMGESNEDKAKVSQWLSFQEKHLKNNELSEATCDMLEQALLTNSYLVSNHVTLADISVFYSIHPFIVKDVNKFKAKYINLIRWYDQIQHTDSVYNSIQSIDVLDFAQQGNARKGAVFVPPTKTGHSDMSSSQAPTQLKQQTSTASSKSANTAKNAKGDAKGDAKAEKAAAKAEKKAKAKAANPGKAAAKASKNQPKANTEQPLITCLEIKVGKIVKAWKHPEAEKLYCENIDVGEEHPRDICSGLVNFYSDASMIEGKLCLVITNLKPVKMVGFKSHGMVLCASNADKSSVEIVEPPAGSVPGEVLQLEGLLNDGESFEPMTSNQLAKKKIFEKVKVCLKTNDKCEASWSDESGKAYAFKTSAGICKVPKIANGTIS